MKQAPTNIVKYLYRLKGLSKWSAVFKYLQMGLVCSNYSRYYSVLYVIGQHYLMSPVKADFSNNPQENRLQSIVNKYGTQLLLNQGGAEHNEDAEIAVAGQNIYLDEFYGLNKMWYWLYHSNWLISQWALHMVLGTSYKNYSIFSNSQNFKFKQHRRRSRKFIFSGPDSSTLRTLTTNIFKLRPANTYKGTGVKRKKIAVRRKPGKQDARTGGRR